MNEILKYAIDNGMIDLEYVRETMEMNKREEILKKHTYKIWQGTDLYWNTYLHDKKNGRKRIKKKTREEIEDIVIDCLVEEAKNPTVKDIFKESISRRLQLGKIRKSTYDRDTRVFNRHYSEFGRKKIKSSSDSDFIFFLPNSE